jgi:hypothetical protein
MDIAEPKWKHRTFYDEIDSMVPPWEPSVHVTSHDGDQGAVLYPTSEPSQRVALALFYDNATGEPRQGEFTMPFQKYLRAMDHAGNIVPLTIKTCQIAAEDQTGFEQSIVARKVQAGWIVCERNWPNAYGLQGETYAEFLRKEWLKRRRDHARRESAQERNFMSAAQKSAEEDRKLQGEALERHAEMSREMVADMVPAIAHAVAQGLAAAQAAEKRK